MCFFLAVVFTQSSGAHGETLLSMNAKIMDLYMRKYGVKHEAFAPFPVAAHRNAHTSPHALLKHAITPTDYEHSRTITAPIQVE